MLDVNNALSVSRCCCGCTDCCNGSFPDEFDIDLTLVDDACVVCSSLGGTYTLAKVSGAVCNWRYDSGAISVGCDPPYGLTITRKVIELSIRCYGDTQYRIDINYQIYFANPCPGGGVDEWQAFGWRKFVNTADFNCATADAVVIPYLAGARARSIAAWVCSIAPGVFYTVPFDWACDASADAVLTAVP